MISFGILAIAMPFMTVLPTVETRTFFLEKKGGSFLSTIQFGEDAIGQFDCVVPSSLTASREGSFLFELSKLLDSPEVLCSLGNGY